MKTFSSNLRAPLLAIVMLLSLLLMLLFLPDPLRLTKPHALVHTARPIVRHAPTPVLRHVRDVAHRPPHP
ncbi:hypothetical protein [Hymenobacter sp.]|jgi:hypothetical protein|uniref:hypothetical protein n=1 Tax=Hymenobacter sp. TaxID=1898978 RepID=UPI002ED9B903